MCTPTLFANIILDNDDDLSDNDWKRLGRPHCWVQVDEYIPSTGSNIVIWKDTGYGANMIIHNDVAVISYLPIIFTHDKSWIIVLDEDSSNFKYDVYQRRI